MTELERLQPYLRILAEPGRAFETYPAIAGVHVNQFYFLVATETHLQIRNAASDTEYALPCALVEFVNPGAVRPVVRLTRPLRVHAGQLV